MSLLKKSSNALEKVGLIISTALLVVIFCLVFSGVILRVIGNSFSMSEELSRWGLISLCFIGASVALKRKQHVGVNMLISALPPRIAKIGVTISYVVVFILLCLSFFYGLTAALEAKDIPGDIIPLSMMYVKFCIPLGMFMMIVHLLSGFVELVDAKDVKNVLIGS